MATRRIKNESFENMAKVIPDASKLEAHVEIDPVTADACIQHDAVVKHVEEVKEELIEKAEDLVPEAEEPKNPVENGYTASLKLDESFANFTLNEDYFDTDEYRVTRYQDDIAECIEFITEKLEELENKFNEGKYTAKAYADKLAKIYDYLTHDMLHRHLVECDETVVECDKLSLDECDDVITEADGRSNRVDEEDDKDKHLDFDMADFLMCLVADADDMNPKSPLGRKFKKFNNTIDNDEEGFDEYASQVGATDSEVTVYGDTVERFDDIIAICNEYKLSYKGPTASKNTGSYWKYYLDIKIPVDESGLPMLVEDYFATVYPEEADTVMFKVMPDAFARAYYRKKDKMNKEQAGISNDIAVRKALKAAITAASLDGSRPLTDFLDDLYAQLDGLKYDKKKITKEFNDAFAGDKPEEDDE